MSLGISYANSYTFIYVFCFSLSLFPLSVPLLSFYYSSYLSLCSPPSTFISHLCHSPLPPFPFSIFCLPFPSHLTLNIIISLLTSLPPSPLCPSLSHPCSRSLHPSLPLNIFPPPSPLFSPATSGLEAESGRRGGSSSSSSYGDGNHSGSGGGAAHFRSPWQQSVNVFGSWSRPECVEELHQQAQLNLQCLLQGKDGWRGREGNWMDWVNVCVCVDGRPVYWIGGEGVEEKVEVGGKVFTCVCSVELHWHGCVGHLKCVFVCVCIIMQICSVIGRVC